MTLVCDGLGPGSDRLATGEHLAENQFLTSKGGAYKLIYKSDGNLVGYDVKNNSEFWSIGKTGYNAGQIILQSTWQALCVQLFSNKYSCFNIIIDVQCSLVYKNTFVKNNTPPFLTKKNDGAREKILLYARESYS